MCIVLLTTAHPNYALIVIDNRDEFILRPTSRPHWWSPATSPGAGTPIPTTSPPPPTPVAASQQLILSARDLQRPEHGTWLGITKAGHFAVLTNFREDAPNDAAHPIHGQRSRGGMVTAWLAADRAEATEQFVARMLAGPGVRGVGGFSLICGKLRKSLFTTPDRQPLAIISNRADHADQVPWIAGHRGAVYGLSNASYDDPDVWPKVRDGKAALQEVADAAATATATATTEDDLRERLFGILDRDTLPRRDDLSFEDMIPLLKHSVFIPALGDEVHRAAMDKAVAGGPRLALGCAKDIDHSGDAADAELASDERPDQQATGFMTGLYGTQRQTVILVDWEGRVSFTERALWDANGIAIPRGEGDVHFEFQIEGWDEEE